MTWCITWNPLWCIPDCTVHMYASTMTQAYFYSRFGLDFLFTLYFFGWFRVCWPLLCLCHTFLYFWYVWIRTQSAAVTSRRATNLATHLPTLAAHLPNLATYLIHLPILATLPPRFSYTLQSYSMTFHMLDSIPHHPCRLAFFKGAQAWPSWVWVFFT